jgi:hypothetical protein
LEALVKKWIGYAICLPLVGWIVGCTNSPYVDGYYYSPQQVVATAPATQPGQPPPAQVSASIVGIRVEDDANHLPQSVEVRVRIDNYGPYQVTLDPRSMQLTTASLYLFPPPVFQSPAPVSLNPQDSVIVGAFFPFTAGKSYDDFDMASLRLRWTLVVGGASLPQIADFQRTAVRYYYEQDPYWHPYGYYAGPYIGGVVVIHGRR